MYGNRATGVYGGKHSVNKPQHLMYGNYSPLPLVSLLNGDKPQHLMYGNI